MTPSRRWWLGGVVGAALCAGLGPLPVRPAVAQERPTEAEELRNRARALLQRLPEVGRLLISREISEWDAMDLQRRGRLERWIDLLLPMDADALARLFAAAGAAAADARMQKAAEALDGALVVGVPKPDPDETRVVIVIVGGGYGGAVRTMSQALASQGATHPQMPLTVGVVRPWGMLFTKFSAKIPKADFFLAMLLQGRSTPMLDPRGGSKQLAAPSVGEMYRKLLGPRNTGRDVWVIYRNADIVADYSTAKGFGDKYAQIALYADRMQNLAKVRIDEEVLEYRKDDKSPFDISRHIAGLSAAKLRIDTLFTDKQVQEFIRGQVARASGPDINSDVFVARATADLLRSAINPRIVIARLGGPTPGPDGRIANTDRDRFVVDTDRHIGTIWSASRASDRWRNRTYFWLILENSSLCFVSGPGIAPNSTASGSAKLTQVVPTIAKMLRLDPEEMAGSAKGASKKPIEDLFK